MFDNQNKDKGLSTKASRELHCPDGPLLSLKTPEQRSFPFEREKQLGRRRNFPGYSPEGLSRALVWEDNKRCHECLGICLWASAYSVLAFQSSEWAGGGGVKSLRMPLLGETISAIYFLAKISHAYSKELIRKVLLLRKAHLCLTM